MRKCELEKKLNKISYDVGNRLIALGKTISSCESCTGGLFAQSITNISGISSVFDRGIVTYTEKSKIEELNVNPITLKKFTVYSHEVAKEMAYGLWEKTGSEICVSITGIAGPEGGNIENPVGTMYIGLCKNGKTITEVIHGNNDREENRLLGTIEMFELIQKTLIDTKNFDIVR